MKKFILISLMIVSLIACSNKNEEELPKPGDPDFVGPLTEEQMKQVENNNN